MAGQQKKHPYNLPMRPSPLSRLLLTPAQAALLGSAATAALYPTLLAPHTPGLSSLAGATVLRLPLVDKVLPFMPNTPRLYAATVAFVVIFGTERLARRLRVWALRRLLAWQGWIFNMKSLKTKVWAMSVKLLSGPGPYTTQEFQAVLPKEPLPSLNDTLDLWLEVAENFVTPEEFLETKQVVEQFRRNEGPKIQAYLENKAKTSPSWIYEYWLTAAYLANRNPLPMQSNYHTAGSVPKSRTSDQLSKAANFVYGFLKYGDHVFKNEAQPVMIQGFIPLCMQGYRFVNSSVRIPKEHIDTLEVYPESRHLMVISKGQYYKMPCYKRLQNGREVIMSVPELYVQLKRIQEMAAARDKEVDQPLPVAALTSQSRPVWAKQREQLAKQNKNTLHAVESAIFMVHLEENSPQNDSEVMKMLQTGDGSNRWYDKNYTSVTFPNCMIGTNTEHTHIDASVFSAFCENSVVAENYDENGKAPGIDKVNVCKLPVPERLEWNLSGLEDTIKKAAKDLQEVSEAFDLEYMQLPFGKGHMKKARLSPDGFIQMGLQLAFYRMHKHVPKTYEPSTRRTETIHPASQHMLAWLKAMDDPMFPRESCKKLLRDSIKHQTKFRLNATIGKACDRHLLAMLCASQELGMDMPQIFTDKAWTMPFELSTSQTPTDMYNQNDPSRVTWTHVNGGFGPACHHGYGCCYCVLGEDVVNMSISSWKTCADTSSARLRDNLTKAMKDMLLLFDIKPPA